MSHRVQDKVVIVTGGAQGIGFGIAEMLAQEGARVVIADKQADKGEAAAARIRDAGGQAFRPVSPARAQWGEPGIIMKLLDVGALGAVCPMSNSQELLQALQVLRGERPPHRLNPEIWETRQR